jgi:hypothetical protein
MIVGVLVFVCVGDKENVRAGNGELVTASGFGIISLLQPMNKIRKIRIQKTTCFLTIIFFIFELKYRDKRKIKLLITFLLRDIVFSKKIIIQVISSKEFKYS